MVTREAFVTTKKPDPAVAEGVTTRGGAEDGELARGAFNVFMTAVAPVSGFQGCPNR